MTDHVPPTTGHDPAGPHDAHDDAGHADAAHDAAGAGGHGADHDEMVLGPTDWTAWAVGVLAVLAGAVVAVCAAISTGAIAV